MIIFKQAEQLNQYLKEQKSAGKQIGFVPTMGALHAGHLSLIVKSKEKTSLTLCSIFVNPRQFNNLNDLEHYPVSLEQDIQLLEESGCDVLFLPAKTEIYPDNHTFKKYDLGSLETILEGQHRPGHFQGVCAVVDRLLEFCICDYLFLGQKDYQQCLVIKKLLQILNRNINLMICPTKREKDGLAMSSRNVRLDLHHRKQASVLHKALCHVMENKCSSLSLQYAEKMIRDNGFELEYLKVCNQELEEKKGNENTDVSVVLVAATLDGVRLIDNISNSL